MPSDDREGVPGHATLHNVAKLAGVSQSTASRVLNADDESAARQWASLETIRRVRAVALKLGYRPNPHAVGLRTKRSGLVGVIVPRLQDYVLSTIYEGIDEAAREHGIGTVVANSLDSSEIRGRVTNTMLSRRVDGIIFGDAHLDGSFLRNFENTGVPFVLVSRSCKHFPSATTNDEMGGSLAGHHLGKMGATDVAILAGQPWASTAQDRTRGAVQALSHFGVSVPSDRIVYGPFDAPGGRSAAEGLFDRPPYPDAIFATNDFAAIGAMGALRDRGLKIPEDVLIVGYNDTPLARELPIPLTSIASPMHEMGRAGMDMVVELMQGGSPPRVRLTPTLEVRASTVVNPPRRS